MARLVYIQFLVAGALLLASQCGCVIPRNPSGLAKKDCPPESVAVLPVQISPRVRTKDYNYEELQVLGNRVLNTITKATDDNLISPQSVEELLAGASLPSLITNFNGFSQQQISPAALDELLELSDKLSTCYVVRSRLAAFKHSPEIFGADGLGASWEANVTVDMELIDLNIGVVCRRARGRSTAGGAAGVVGNAHGFLPFYFHSTLGRAVDHAFRDAFEKMYQREEDRTTSAAPTESSTELP